MCPRLQMMLRLLRITEPAQADSITDLRRVDLNTPITFSKAESVHSQNWGSHTLALHALLDWVSKLHAGEKGRGEVWAPGTFKDDRRLGSNALGTDLIVFDSDDGHTLAELRAQFERLGWYARIIPSSGWGTTETDAPHGEFVAWTVARRELEGKDANTTAERYLVEELHKTPAVAKDAVIRVPFFHKEKKEKNKQGQRQFSEMVQFGHKPCEKYRIICVLSQRYDLSTQTAREDWKKYYSAAADQIGLPLDPNCATPERLFYLSHLSLDRLKLARDHQAEVQGGAIDLAALPMPEQPHAGLTTGASLPSQADRKKPGPLFRLNEIALTPANLALWVPELLPMAMFHEGTGAWRVTSADLGRAFEEDLSISPTGIRDFGPDTKRNPVGLVIEYGEAVGIVGETEEEKNRAAAKWLAKTIGMSWPRDFQDGLKIGSGVKVLKIGSDVEIAKKLAEHLRRDHDGRVVAAEGQIYRYDGRRWAPIPDRELRLLVHEYDGALFQDAAEKRAVVRLSDPKINSILKVLTTVLTTDEAFFANPTAGINVLNGLIRFVGEGKAARVEVVAHDPDHRHRHVIQVEYHPDRERLHDLVLDETLLGTLLNGSFEGESDATDKWSLLAEVAGVAAAGAAPLMAEQKAVILLGETAENGKSQFLNVMRGLLPDSAVCSMSPADFQDEKNRMALAGKLLNATDEISSANAITSELFKEIITCDLINGRDLYKPPVKFRPQAQHVLATNGLPPFKGGMDPGVKRRLVVIPFSRVIPKEERIPHLGERIVHEEMDLVLAWAVEGLLRVARNGWKFTELAASVDRIEDWLDDLCSVTAWLKSGEAVFETPVVDGRERPIPTTQAFKRYQAWTKDNGFRPDQIVARNTFTSRVNGSGLGPKSKHTNTGAVFLNLCLNRNDLDAIDPMA